MVGLTPQLSRPVHRWADDACLVCGLLRLETWVLNHRGQAVMAVVWMSPARSVVRVLEFAYFTGMTPSALPSQTREQAYPDCPVGGEPACLSRARRWLDGADLPGEIPALTGR